jgi:uncharacterized membrane protein YkoI
MKQAATSTWRHWTGRLLPVLGVGLLLLQPGLAISKDKKKNRLVDPVPVQGMREPPRAMAAVSVDRIIADVERRYNARVVDHKQSESNGRRVHVLKLYSEKNGKVWTVRVDAETGREM